MTARAPPLYLRGMRGLWLTLRIRRNVLVARLAKISYPAWLSLGYFHAEPKAAQVPGGLEQGRRLFSPGPLYFHILRLTSW